MRTKFSYLLITVIALVADQLTKLWATASLKPVVFIEVVPGFFRLSYATNRGVAFSLFADSQFDIRWILAGISLVAALFVFSYFRRAPDGKPWLNVSLSLLLAGIVGNMIDRIRLGEVVDFIELHWRDLYSWPTFNIADSAICVGAVLLALEMLREEKAARIASSAPPTSAPEETGIRSSEN
ncbi:MAG: Lipoprotein signal peptidase [Acidobacteria bacterium]|nr:Lipoprotein signal peptidase [Acidobacteriota bacterium]